MIFISSGPIAELYYAEEAIGLAKSLSFNIVKGPYWNPACEKSQEDTIILQPEQKVGRKKKIKTFKDKENIKDGDYVFSLMANGIKWKGGIIIDNLNEKEDAKINLE